MPISGLSASQLASLRNEAQRLVSKYDRNNDGRVTRDELDQRVSMGSDSYSFSDRISRDYVNRTTVYQDHFASLNADQIAGADRNGDGVDSDELLDAYLERKDSNHNGNLSWWERLSTSVGNMRDTFERDETVETNRTTDLEFDPDPYWNNNPYSPGPVPPSPDPYRPAPPPVYDPTPYHPYNPGPTPPAPSGRPTPPPVYGPGSGSGSRPTPPAPSGRPTPPPVYGPGSSSRPTPPSPGSSSRPTPPRVR